MHTQVVIKQYIKFNMCKSTSFRTQLEYTHGVQVKDTPYFL